MVGLVGGGDTSDLVDVSTPSAYDPRLDAGLAMTGMVTAAWMPSDHHRVAYPGHPAVEGSRMSAGDTLERHHRGRPAPSATRACSAMMTSTMTSALSVSARPARCGARGTEPGGCRHDRVGPIGPGRGRGPAVGTWPAVYRRARVRPEQFGALDALTTLSRFVAECEIHTCSPDLRRVNRQ